MRTLGETKKFGRKNGVLVPLGIPSAEEPGDGGGGVVTTFNLEVDPGFDPLNPTLKNGVTLTGDAALAYEGIRWYLQDPDNRQVAWNFASEAAGDDLYHYARPLAEQYAALLVGLRLTGDVAFLDEIVRLSDIQFNQLAVGWRDYDSSVVFGGGDSQYQHPYRMWVVHGGGNDSIEWGGTDMSTSNNSRTHAVVCQIARALKANVGATSPAGYNYQLKYDQWEDYLWNDFRHAWSGHFGESFVESHNNYWGDRDRIGQSGRGRPELGGYPFFHRRHTHTSIGCAMLHWEWGLLFGEQAATDAALVQFSDFLDYQPLTIPNGRYGGESITWSRSLQFFDWNDNQYHHPTTYARYMFKDFYELWLSGEYNAHDLVSDFLTPAWKQINWRVLDRTIQDGNGAQGVSGDLNSNETATGENPQGESLTLNGSGFDSQTNNLQFIISSYAMTLPFDAPDDHGEETIRQIWDATSAEGGTNGLTEAGDLRFPLGLIAKHGGVGS